MAAWVEATTREMGQSLINPDKPSVSASALPGDTGKPALGPKPHLMPKPFALQRNATVRPIRAPKTNFSRELHRAASSEALLDTKKPGAGGPNTSESLKSGSNGTVYLSAAPKPVPLCLKPDLLAKPKPEPTKSPGSNNQTGPNSKPGVTAEDVKVVQPRSRAKSLGSQDQKILNQKVQGEAAKTEAGVKVSSRCWPPRNRLSVELTSKFESPSQPEKEVRRDSETSKTEKEWPPHSPSESKPSKLLVDTGEMGDEDVSGGSIKTRISLLFDRSTAVQHRDTFNKRDNPAAEISVDIKQRIQNLSLDAPRIRLPSTGGPKSPPSEKTLSTSDETPNERSSEKPAATEKVPVDKPPSAAEIKNSAASVENVEEEEDREDEEEDYVPAPVYQRVGMSLDAEIKRREQEEKQRKDEQLEKERQQRERESLLEEERKAREIERQKEQERKCAEEERKQEEEKQRQMEERRKQEEERKRRIEEERKEEERRRQAEKERERQIEEEKRRIEEEKERLREEERLKKEREMEKERRRIQELERQREEERLRQEREKQEREMEERKRMEEERLKEEERLRQEQEKERLKKEKEMEEERRRIQELERQKEEERLRQEREKEARLKKQREMEERKRMEEERLKEERLRQEREMERLRKDKEMEEEKQRIQEIERKKEEERLRKERELERIRKEKEMEEERRRIQEIERQKEEERLRKERELERIRKEKEMEEERKRVQEIERQKEERLRKERELERIRKEKEMEEERRRIQELERQKEEERLRQERELERIRKEKEMEEERRRIQEIEREKEEERLRQERELERTRKEKEMEEERRRTERLKEEKRRQEREHEMEMETCEAAERLREEVPTSYNLISFDAEEPAASQTPVSTVQTADVSPQVIYDDFSVKPRRWGTRARRSSTPSPSRETPAAPDHSLQPESKSSHPGPQEPSGDQVSVHDLIGFEPEASSPHNSTESRTHTYLFEEETESKPGDLLEPETDEGQLKDGEPEENGVAEQDTENLIEETDEQRENNEAVDDHATQIRVNQALQRLTQARRRNRSTDSDPADVPVLEETKELLPVLESAAPLLDSSVFRSKVALGKKRSIKRTKPSRAVRQRAALPALSEGTQPDWRFCDSTDAKDQCSNGANSESEEEEEEEPSRDVTSSPAPRQPKRVPVFPGMDPSALMAQLKRRSGVIETESPTEAQMPPSVPSRSPRTPTMALGPRVLPPVDAKDSGSGSSPSWLLELKSKKRMNQPESEA